MFHLLSNQRRRGALRYLAEHEGTVAMRDLAEWIAAREHETTVAQLTSDERQRVYIALYQSHLPKLADYGIIEYDQSRGVVQRAARADLLDPYLELDGGTANRPGETTGTGPDTDTGASTGGRAPVSLPGRSALGIGAVGIGMIAIGEFGLLSAKLLLAITWTALIVAISPVDTAELMKRALVTDR